MAGEVSEDAIHSFCGITGATPEQARFYLESSGGAVDTAISAFYDHGEGGDGDAAGAALGDAAEGVGPGAGGGWGGASAAMTSHGLMSVDEDKGDEVQQRPGRGAGGSRRGGAGASGKIRTLGDIGKGGDDEEDEDDDDDGPQEYYTGGEKSGMMVQDPNRRRGGAAPGASAMDAERLFDLARQHGARQGRPGELEEMQRQQQGGLGGTWSAFTGQGQRLGAAATEVPAAASAAPAGGAGGRGGQQQQAQQAQQAQQSTRHVVHLYRNGFTVNNGPLRSFQDPANAAFLTSLSRGEYPKELVGPNTAQEGEVDLVRVSDDYKAPPEPSYVAFQGQGRTLGSASGGTAEAAATVAPAAPALGTGVLPSAATARSTSQGLIVDDSKPVTSIQLRLADGTRLVARFNHTHTVADIRRFIDAARPSRGAAPAYTLQTPGFPPKKLEDDAQTIENAGLVNSVVIQR